jgi:hypothetical protein
MLLSIGIEIHGFKGASVNSMHDRGLADALLSFSARVCDPALGGARIHLEQKEIFIDPYSILWPDEPSA